MADGFDIHVDEDRAARLKAAAERLGLSVADYAMAALDQAMTDDPPLRWVDPDPAIDKAIADEARRTGDTIPWTEFRDRLRRFGGRGE
jgi:hypothetical protein